jgi:hypothetical protein
MVAPPNIWLAKILVDLLVAHDLANIGKKNELHWKKKLLACQIVGNHPNKDQSLVMTKILERQVFVSIQTCH